MVYKDRKHVRLRTYEVCTQKRRQNPKGFVFFFFFICLVYCKTYTKYIYQTKQEENTAMDKIKGFYMVSSSSSYVSSVFFFIFLLVCIVCTKRKISFALFSWYFFIRNNTCIQTFTYVPYVVILLYSFVCILHSWVKT